MHRSTAKRRITHAEFERASHRVRMADRTLRMVYRVLVAGERPSDVSADSGVSTAWVSKSVTKFWSAVEQVQETIAPDDWITGVVTLPASDWPTVRALEQRARKALARSR